MSPIRNLKTDKRELSSPMSNFSPKSTSRSFVNTSRSFVNNIQSQTAREKVITRSPDRMVTSGKPLNSSIIQSSSPKKGGTNKASIKDDPIGASILERENDGSKVNVILREAKCT
jgi:hypothetical protein